MEIKSKRDIKRDKKDRDRGWKVERKKKGKKYRYRMREIKRIRRNKKKIESERVKN